MNPKYITFEGDAKLLKRSGDNTSFIFNSKGVVFKVVIHFYSRLNPDDMWSPFLGQETL
jgi:hypothetical protein